MKRALPLALLIAACGDPDPLPPQGQLLLYIDTDAVVPDSEAALPGELLAPMPLFDRMTIEVLLPGSSEPCDGCQRELALDRAQLARGEASVGIVPGAGVEGLRARVRLFRAESLRDGVPPPATTLVTTVRLPAVAEEGIVEVTATLFVDTIAIPIGDPDNPVDATPGRPDGHLVGTWPWAQRVPCTGAPQPGEVCIPGGTYWMGETGLLGAEIDGDAERLVVLPPFFMDATEVTVAAYRLSGLPVQTWSGLLDGIDPNLNHRDWCTSTVEPGDREARAVNCVGWEDAQAYCLARGADLPSEAQYEYVARALGDRRYVWGHEPPDCDDAVWGHGTGYTIPGSCPAPNVIGGPLAPGSGQRDRLVLPGGTVFDLAGNVREWMRDTWNAQGEGCWAYQPLLFDPVCQVPGAAGKNIRSTRGDGWFEPSLVDSAAARSASNIGIVSPFDGFRCVRADL